MLGACARPTRAALVETLCQWLPALAEPAVLWPLLAVPAVPVPVEAAPLLAVSAVGVPPELGVMTTAFPEEEPALVGLPGLAGLPVLAGWPVLAGLPVLSGAVADWPGWLATTVLQEVTVLATVPPCSVIRPLKAKDESCGGVVEVFVELAARNAVHRPNWAWVLAGPVMGTVPLVKVCGLWLEPELPEWSWEPALLDPPEVAVATLAWLELWPGRSPATAAAAVPRPRAAAVAAAATLAVRSLESIGRLLGVALCAGACAVALIAAGTAAVAAARTAASRASSAGDAGPVAALMSAAARASSGGASSGARRPASRRSAVSGSNDERGGKRYMPSGQSRSGLTVLHLQREFLGCELFQRPVLQHPDRPRAFAHDPGDLLHVEAAEHPQKDDLGLVGAERSGYAPGCLQRGQVPEDLPLRVVRTGQGLVGTGVGGRVPPLPPVLHEPVVGDGEQPGPEARLVAAEARDLPGDGHPRLGGQVLRLAGDAGGEVAQQQRVVAAVEQREGPLPTCPGRREDRLELLARGLHRPPPCHNDRRWKRSSSTGEAPCRSGLTSTWRTCGASPPDGCAPNARRSSPRRWWRWRSGPGPGRAPTGARLASPTCSRRRRPSSASTWPRRCSRRRPPTTSTRGRRTSATTPGPPLSSPSCAPGGSGSASCRTPTGPRRSTSTSSPATAWTA